ncbi:dihydropteroate synthase [Ichthyobacterium seriolicida]|uniref:dihydropteroate synthase n=2 Tax=Ichthyobacterium seriolicida TaxID=242600 RepID=A0A1J1EBL1_9FLAO|nr:dihydropteroate synthase [Ichthyobacterium seriolicida]
MVMGIVNITPDSFYEGSRYKNDISLLKKVENMIDQGMDFLDIGSYSSRPGAKHISLEEEKDRILPVIKNVIKHFGHIIISVDTFRSEVAKMCVNEGAAIINDISGGSMDKNMFETVSKLQVPYVLTHMLGVPQTMQMSPEYDNVVKDVLKYFSTKTLELKKLGVNDIIIDVGFGFGKTIDHNYELLKKLDLFKCFKLPILAGISRKSMIYKPLDISPEESINGSTVLNTILLQKGVNILRVHDVKEAKQVVALTQKIVL